MKAICEGLLRRIGRSDEVRDFEPLCPSDILLRRIKIAAMGVVA
jgi:hypothetical protein